MAQQWQIRRGTNSENNNFTGAIGEVTMDTDRKELRLHDGSTQGGTIIGRNYKSNCITEIPQDIKLELDTNTHTIKLTAGSKYYYPDGTNTFNDNTTTTELTLAPIGSYTGQCMIYVVTDGSVLAQAILPENTSGTTAPTGNGVWYDTNTNLIKSYSGGSDTGNRYSFPIAIATRTNGNWTSIDQVFNGLGYIGQSVFSLPGIKGLIPNDRNADGTLKNTEFTTTNVYVGATFSFGNIVNNQVVAINSTGIIWQNWIGEYDHEPAVVQYAAYYNSTTNKMYFAYSATEWTELDRAVAGFFSTTTSGVITELNTRQSFRAVDYSEADFVVAFQRPTAANNYTWYRRYKSGWVEQGGTTGGITDAQVTVAFPIPFATTPNVQLTRSFTTFDGTAAQNQTTGIGALTTTSFKCYDYAWSGSVKGIAWWRAEGMAA